MRWWRCILEQGAKESAATSGHQPRPPATGCGECFGNIEIIARIVNIITNTDTAANNVGSRKDVVEQFHRTGGR